MSPVWLFLVNLEVGRCLKNMAISQLFFVEDERCPRPHPSRCGEMKEHYNDTGHRTLLLKELEEEHREFKI